MKKIVRQVVYLQGLYRDARSAEHTIKMRLRLVSVIILPLSNKKL